MATGIYSLVDHVSKFYLNEKDSDVTLIVNGKKLPAHRLILKLRCSYFEHMFNNDMKESRTGQVVIKESSVKAVKIVLKWIYTGILKLADFNSNLQVLRLAHMYDLPEVVDSVTDHLEYECTIDNVVALLNTAVLYSLDDLKERAIKVWKREPETIFENDDFLYFTPDALEIILKCGVKNVSNFTLLQLFIQWMKENTYRKPHFLKLLKLIPLTLIFPLVIPSELIDKTDVLNVLHEQQKKAQALACCIGNMYYRFTPSTL